MEKRFTSENISYAELVALVKKLQIDFIGLSKTKLLEELNFKFEILGEEKFNLIVSGELEIATPSVVTIPSETDILIANQREEERKKHDEFLSKLIDKRNQLLDTSIIKVYDYAIEMFGKAFKEGGSVPLEHTMSNLQRGWGWNEPSFTDKQEEAHTDILRMAETYSHMFMTLDEVIEYFKDDKNAQRIIRGESGALKSLFETGLERYLTCKVTFDHSNNQISNDYIYSYEAALGEILLCINTSNGGDAVCIDFIRNDKARYTFSLEADAVEDYESEEDEEFDEEEEEN